VTTALQLWTAFLLGLAGSFHCAGMCGPLVLAMPAAGGRLGAHVAGKIAYNAGRIATYSLLGLLAGLFGRMLGLPGVQRWVSLALGAAILLSLLALPLRQATTLIARPVHLLKQALGKLLKAQSLPAQFAFGALNGLLPCGLVYAASLAAAATGTALAGLQYMALFGLGTVPMMLGLALAGRLFHFRLQPHLHKLVPASLGVMATLLILRGLGLGIPYLSPNLDPANPAAATCCQPAQ
jgi:sulfite exporter TauE/SafE